MRKRFKKDMAASVQKYTESISYDRRLYKYDIAGSVVHAAMLAQQGIISDKEARQICDGLASIWKEIEKGKFVFKEEHEDIHMNVEARLIEKIGRSAPPAERRRFGHLPPIQIGDARRRSGTGVIAGASTWKCLPSWAKGNPDHEAVTISSASSSRPRARSGQTTERRR